MKYDVGEHSEHDDLIFTLAVLTERQRKTLANYRELLFNTTFFMYNVSWKEKQTDGSVYMQNWNVSKVSRQRYLKGMFIDPSVVIVMLVLVCIRYLYCITIHVVSFWRTVNSKLFWLPFLVATGVGKVAAVYAVQKFDYNYFCLLKCSSRKFLHKIRFYGWEIWANSRLNFH